MSDPITFDSTTARFKLPLLFSGQSQKEAFVNEGLVLLDALMHCIVEGEANSPPVTPIEGSAWIVGQSPVGDWSGLAGKLACRVAGQWVFVTPQDGMRIMNRLTGQTMRRLSGTWLVPAAPNSPSGGSVVDAEARSVLNALIQRLRDAGVFPTS